MKDGIQALIMKINEDSDRHAGERYSQIRDAIDNEVEGENKIYREEDDKQREVLRKHNEHEYARRIEYQRSRLNRELRINQFELADEIFGLAVEKLREASEEEFSVMFLAAVKGLKGRYVVHPGALSEKKISGRALSEAMGENVGLDVTLSVEAIPHKSGFLLRNDMVEYNHLFEDLIEDLKRDQAASVMKEIFGDSADWLLGKEE